jgi:hypothetical protein
MDGATCMVAPPILIFFGSAWLRQLYFIQTMFVLHIDFEQ